MLLASASFPGNISGQGRGPKDQLYWINTLSFCSRKIPVNDEMPVSREIPVSMEIPVNEGNTCK